MRHTVPGRAGAASILLLAGLAGGAQGQGRAAENAGFENQIIEEMNLARTDPAGYARVLREQIPRFDGKVLRRPGQIAIRTVEGAPAVVEAAAILDTLTPMGPLTRSAGLARAAREHVRDQGPTGGMEHRGTDGSTPAIRADRYGTWDILLSENISFGAPTAREVVTQLIIDDGVPSRGHRRNLLNPEARVAGAACGPHRTYRIMCVIDYAGSYVERK